MEIFGRGSYAFYVMSSALISATGWRTAAEAAVEPTLFDTATVPDDESVVYLALAVREANRLFVGSHFPGGRKFSRRRARFFGQGSLPAPGSGAAVRASAGQYPAAVVLSNSAFLSPPLAQRPPHRRILFCSARSLNTQFRTRPDGAGCFPHP